MLLNCSVGEGSWDPLDCKEIQPVHPKRDQSWVFIGRTDVEAETPILWPPDAKSWLIWKDPDAGKDWGQEEKGTTEDEIAGWHHWLTGHEFGWTLGVGDGQGGLICCSPWGRKESDTTEQLNRTYWFSFNKYFSSYVCMYLHIRNQHYLSTLSTALSNTSTNKYICITGHANNDLGEKGKMLYLYISGNFLLLD